MAYTGVPFYPMDRQKIGPTIFTKFLGFVRTYKDRHNDTSLRGLTRGEGGRNFLTPYLPLGVREH